MTTNNLSIAPQPSALPGSTPMPVPSGPGCGVSSFFLQLLSQITADPGASAVQPGALTPDTPGAGVASESAPATPEPHPTQPGEPKAAPKTAPAETAGIPPVTALFAQIAATQPVTLPISNAAPASVPEPGTTVVGSVTPDNTPASPVMKLEPVTGESTAAVVQAAMIGLPPD